MSLQHQHLASLWIRRFAAALFVLLLLPPSVLAQNAGGSLIVAEQQPVIRSLAGHADRLAARLEASRRDDAQLVDIRLELEQLADELLQSGVAFRPRLSEINARLEQLGPAPPEGAAPEPVAVADERRALTEEKSQINILIGQAEGTSLRVNRQIDRIAALRRELFASTLSKRYDIDAELLREVANSFQAEIGELYRTIASWLRFVTQFKLPSVLAAAFLALAGAALLLIGGRRVFGSYIAADPNLPDPSYLSRVSVAFWSTLLRSAALVVFLGATWFFFDYYKVLRGDIGGMLGALFTVIAIVSFVHRLASAILCPNLSNWRLVPIDSRPARMLRWLITAMACVAAVDYLLTAVFGIMGSPLALTVGQSLLATVIIGILLMLIARVRPFTDENGAARAWPLPFRVLLYSLGGVTIATALLGYIGFARFLSHQIVVTGAILAMMYVGFLSARALSAEGAFAFTALGRRVDGRFKPSEAMLDQLGLALSVTVNMLVLLVGIPLILLQWGFQWGDIRAWTYSIANEIRIGTVSFSLIGILTGILVFLIGFFATRWFQGWLDGSVMARGRVDTGVRNSIRTAVGYAGVAVAALIGISAAGIDLSNLALVAGALSLGIGFGLQNVVSNFVSGLILLAERPFKVGDWIVAGAVSGTVKKISVRATEIETFQRQTVILPNSELINAAVGNWTHRNRLGRIDIRVTVAYGEDVRRAHATLVEIARAHPLVLKNPEPFVLFLNFAHIGLEFEMRVFVADILNGNIVQNDIRFAVLEAFDEVGIEMPSAPRAQVEAKPPEAAGDPPDTGAGDASVPLPPAAVAANATPAQRTRRKPDPD